jgi:hypothetical protein
MPRSAVILVFDPNRASTPGAKRTLEVVGEPALLFLSNAPA